MKGKDQINFPIFPKQEESIPATFAISSQHSQSDLKKLQS
jgi:hypothetical protein